MNARSSDGVEKKCLGLLGAGRSWLPELRPINTSESVLLDDAPVLSALLWGSCYPGERGVWSRPEPEPH